MSKLKRIINQLDDNELKIIYNSLVDSDAHKSAELLKHFRDDHLNDSDIKDKLGVNNNAFYTLRSRLNEKIETFFLQQMESPQTALLRQVASINEIILTKKRTIAIATLKKLERELLDYDLSNELTIVYKALKKLHINSPDYYEYSQKYNKHVAYMLAVDKAEDRLTEYFKIYGAKLLAYDESEDLSLTLISDELQSISDLYKSHRLFVFKTCQEYFSKLFIEKGGVDEEYFEERFKKIEKIFNTYNLDTTYVNLRFVFEYLQMLKAYKFGNYHMVDRQIEKLNKVSSNILTNYSSYTCALHFLFIKMERYVALGMGKELHQENKTFFNNFDVDFDDLPTYTYFTCYQAISAYEANQTQEAINLLENLLEDVNLKNYNIAQIDLKLLLVLFYIKINKADKGSFLLNNVQRHVRMIGKEDCEHSYAFMKVLRSSMAFLELAKKEKKLQNYISRFKTIDKPIYSPLNYIHVEMYDFNLDELNSYEQAVEESM